MVLARKNIRKSTSSCRKKALEYNKNIDPVAADSVEEDTPVPPEITSNGSLIAAAAQAEAQRKTAQAEAKRQAEAQGQAEAEAQGQAAVEVPLEKEMEALVNSVVNLVEKMACKKKLDKYRLIIRKKKHEKKDFKSDLGKLTCFVQDHRFQDDISMLDYLNGEISNSTGEIIQNLLNISNLNQKIDIEGLLQLFNKAIYKYKSVHKKAEILLSLSEGLREMIPTFIRRTPYLLLNRTNIPQLIGL